MIDPFTQALEKCLPDTPTKRWLRSPEVTAILARQEVEMCPACNRAFDDCDCLICDQCEQVPCTCQFECVSCSWRGQEDDCGQRASGRASASTPAGSEACCPRCRSDVVERA